MKIDIITNYYPPEIGAAPNRIYNMAKGLQNIGHDVQIVSPLPNYPKGCVFAGYKGKIVVKENEDGLNVSRYWICPSISKKPLKRAVSMFSFALSMWLSIFDVFSRKPDVVIVQNSPLFVSWSGILLYKLFSKAKIVLNVSDIWPLTALELGVLKRGKVYSILEKVERSNYNNSDLILGQSDEILEHVNGTIGKYDGFLYRNLTPGNPFEQIFDQKRDSFKIVYAGLLGVAQGIYDICKHVNFKGNNIEFHIYGDGNECEEIKKLINESDLGIFYHGSIPKSELIKVLPSYQASIVPLTNRIYGAVPSKIFESASAAVPVLFCGGGEGAKIVNEYGLGLTSEPGDSLALEKNIVSLRQMNSDEYLDIKHRCVEVSRRQFNFERQIKQVNEVLMGLKL